MFIFDTETHLIGPGRLAPTMVCMSYQVDDQPPELAHRDDCLPILNRFLDGEIGGHNICFDLAVVAETFPQLQVKIWKAFNESRVYCTMIAEQMYLIQRGWVHKDPRTGRPPSYSLAALTSLYLGENMTGKSGADAWRFRYRELTDTPISDWPDEAKRYAIEDARLTMGVCLAQKKRFEIKDLPRRMRAAWALHLAGAWGLRTDPRKVQELRKRLSDSISAAHVQLQRGGLVRENGTKDVKAIRARVQTAYASQGIAVPLTEKGGISTAKQVLSESNDGLLQVLAGISADEKLANTYIPVLEQGTRLPINPHWNPIVNTGRTSCRRPNVQNQPREGGVRECYVPRTAAQDAEGEPQVYVQADYSIAELCSLAQVLLWKFGESEMANALQAGRELHLDMAAKLMGISYEDAVARKKTPEVKKARQFAKIVNFGAPGGLGAARLADFAKSSYGVEMSEYDARELRDKWLDAYPEMSRYFKEVAERVQVGGGSFTLTQALSERVRGGVGYTDGCNSPFQGLAADFALDAMYHVSRACYIEIGSPLYLSRIVAFVHDELILECGEGKAHEAALELQKIMERRARLWLPDIPINAEPCIMRRWSKDAEPLWHNGKLHPYEDADALAREAVEAELAAAGIIEDPEMDGGLLG